MAGLKIKKTALRDSISTETLYRLHWEEKKSTRQMAKELGISQSYVRLLMQEKEVMTRDSHRPLQERVPRELLYKLYVQEEMSPKEIAKLIEENENSIRGLLDKYGLRRTLSEAMSLRHKKNPNVNIEFFRNKNEDFYYLLGLLLTDGYVTSDNTIGISLIDKEVIEWIKKKISLKNDIYEEAEEEEYVVQGKVVNKKRRYKIKFQNEEVANILQEYGLIPNKSLILSCPNIPREYQKDFLRGIFDGDGWISIRAYKRKDGTILHRGRFGIGLASRECLESIKTMIESHIGCNRPIYDATTDSVHRYLITDRKDIIKLADFLYENDAFGMKKKKEKMQIFQKERHMEQLYSTGRERDEFGRFKRTD